MMKFNAAIFDMDGLMFDTEELFLRAYETDIGAELGYRFSREKIKQLIGLNQQAALAKFPQLFPGCPEDGAVCMKRFRAWMDDYIRENGVPVKPGLRELLSWLQAEKIPCAVATSTATNVARGYLENAGVLGFFAAIVGGDQVKKSKPDPEIFTLAMRALGKKSPETCVVFEDSRNGLLAGANGGFPVIIVPDLFDPTVELPGLCYAKCARLDEAIAVLQNS